MWNKFLKGTICVLAMVLLCACLAAGWLYLRAGAANSMDPDGKVTLLEQADGLLQLHWPEGENAQRYVLEIRQDETVIFSLETEQTCCDLPELPEGKLTLRIRSQRDYLWMRQEGAEDLQAEFTADAPNLNDLSWTADPLTGNVAVAYQMEPDCICTISRKDTGEVLAKTNAQNLELALAFEAVTLQFQVTRTQGNVTFFGYPCAEALVNDRDYLPEQPELHWTDLGDNRYALSWNETKSSGYRVELSNDGGENWTILAEGEMLSFTTPQLPAFESYVIRVCAADGTASDQVSVETAQKVLYATIWPVQELTVYNDAQAGEKIGTVAAGTAHCVLEETDSMFAIRFGDTVGYVDKNYCMINVTEYLGALCSYDIPNSYCSVYRVHGIDIPEVTDTVITGYEDVLQADGSYLVPVLYPAAQKLLNAALAARESGYRLKIYDSFRPYDATKDIFAKTERILDEKTADGAMTIRALMTDNGRYGLGNFLAPLTSRHNYGVALDLTLESLEGQELRMQTVLHDLSWYSALENNEANADTLQKLMVAAGFKTLQSEWWHFQDADSFDTLKPDYLSGGVSAACWVKDDLGWRYRLADGAFVAGCQWTIDGQTYEFDANGYVA